MWVTSCWLCTYQLHIRATETWCKTLILCENYVSVGFNKDIQIWPYLGCIPTNIVRKDEFWSAIPCTNRAQNFWVLLKMWIFKQILLLSRHWREELERESLSWWIDFQIAFYQIWVIWGTWIIGVLSEQSFELERLKCKYVSNFRDWQFFFREVKLCPEGNRIL